VVTAFIRAVGDVSDYTGGKLAEMEQKVANEVGVGVAAVSITVSAGSVILKVPRGMPQETLT
jgi:peptide deformylase